MFNKKKNDERKKTPFQGETNKFKREKLPKEYKYENDRAEIDDYNKHKKDYYVNEEIDKNVLHDNRHDSANR